MSSERHSDNDGSNVFWPGYVDAVTNLVLNLLFLLTIMTVAVFMFALELGRATHGGAAKEPTVSAQKDTKTLQKEITDPVKENIALKREIERLNIQLAEKVVNKTIPAPAGKIIDVTANVPISQKNIDKTVVSSDSDLVIRFKDEAVAISSSEREKLRELLKPILAAGKTNIYVEVPTGFSEAKRMGFYRVMAVRNLLIEMKMPKERIEVSVREGKRNANASLVRVKSN